jgi:hypothetical protein
VGAVEFFIIWVAFKLLLALVIHVEMSKIEFIYIPYILHRPKPRI